MPGRAEMVIDHVPLTARVKQIDARSWWNIDSNDIGASKLVYRCMREFGWNKDYALRVLKAYRQFLELKKILEDWDDKIVAPSLPVENIWRQHMMDVINYCHDCVLLCGRLVGHDPDGALNELELEKRIQSSKQLLRARFEHDLDEDIWTFGVHSEYLSINKTRDQMQRSIRLDQIASRSLKSASPDVCLSGLSDDQKSAATSHVGSRVYGMDYGIGSATVGSNKSMTSKKTHGHITSDGVELEARDDLADDDDIQYSDLQIRVRTLKGFVYGLRVNTTMTIYQVKSMIRSLYGIPEEQQHLLFYGKALEDSKTLGELNIPNDAGLQLLARSQNMNPMACMY